MVFRTKKTLIICRYFIVALFIGLPIVCLVLGVDSVKNLYDVIAWLGLCLGLLIYGIVIIHVAFWEKLFAILIIKENCICWKCPFRRTIILPIEDCNYIGVQNEESYNGLPYPFVYISKNPYPYEYIGKINKLSCNKEFIKLWYSDELGDCLRSKFPGNASSALLAYQIRLKKRD